MTFCRPRHKFSVLSLSSSLVTSREKRGETRSGCLSGQTLIFLVDIAYNFCPGCSGLWTETNIFQLLHVDMMTLMMSSLPFGCLILSTELFFIYSRGCTFHLLEAYGTLKMFLFKIFYVVCGFDLLKYSISQNCYLHSFPVISAALLYGSIQLHCHHLHLNNYYTQYIVFCVVCFSFLIFLFIF